MFTNTFTPKVGGVTRSILVLRDQLRASGHRVLVVAPDFGATDTREEDVLRVPALVQFGKGGYVLPRPLSRDLRARLEDFGADVIHAHHPFLLGDSALRIAAALHRPVVYTCHTRYDIYAGQALPDGGAARLARSLTAGFCNLADTVIAPSESIRAMLIRLGVERPIRIIPTGVDPGSLSGGDGHSLRARLGIPRDAFVVGHLGRLAVEKNLDYLTEALVRYLGRHDRHWCLVAGKGPMRAKMEARLTDAGLGERARFLDILEGEDFASFYRALDAFAFASRSETQGIVLVEAMMAGCPVVALDAPGAREIVCEGRNGRLLPGDSVEDDFAQALAEMADLPADEVATMSEVATETAARFRADRMGAAAVRLYSGLVRAGAAGRDPSGSEWDRAFQELRKERAILGNMLHALGDAILPDASAPR